MRRFAYSSPNSMWFAKRTCVRGCKIWGWTRYSAPSRRIFPALQIRAKADHAARVTIDETGIEAAAYTILEVRATGMGPSMKKIDFVLDRPFLFVIERASGVPLFTGIVNQP